MVTKAIINNSHNCQRGTLTGAGSTLCWVWIFFVKKRVRNKAVRS